MRNYYTLSLILIALAHCAIVDVLQQSDVVRFKTLARRLNEFIDVADQYYCMQLATELKEKSVSISCDQIKQNAESIEKEFYYYSLKRTSKCKPVIPASIPKAISDVSSLSDVNYALQFPDQMVDANKVTETVFNILNKCSSFDCVELSLSEKVAAISILSRLHDSTTAATKNVIKPYQTIAQALIREVISNKFVLADDNSFFAITDLTLFCATHDLLNQEMAASVMTYLLQFHSTVRPDVAFALLRVTAVLHPLVASSLIGVHANYQNGHIIVHVTDILDQPLKNVHVSIKEKEKVNQIAIYQNGFYSIETEMPVGQHELLITVITEDNISHTINVNICHPMTVSFTSLSINVNGNKNTFSFPIHQSELLSAINNAFIIIDVETTIRSSFTPSTVLLQLSNSDGKKLTIGMQRSQTGFHVEFTPSRKDIASFFDYVNGLFSMTLLCGDIMLREPMIMDLGEIDLTFGSRPGDTLFPLYSKPLMYATEMSLGPMKEIEHVFKADSKNPFILFPFVFCVLIILSLIGVMFVWGRIGMRLKNEPVTKQIAKGLFVCCVGVINWLYSQFWFNGNMVSLLKGLVPCVLITVIVGNRAL